MTSISCSISYSVNNVKIPEASYHDQNWDEYKDEFHNYQQQVYIFCDAVRQDFERVCLELAAIKTRLDNAGIPP